MLELIQITNDAAFAARCDALEGFRLFVDLESLGKAERQAGRNTFISSHQLADVAAVRAAARRSRLMVRVNPLHDGTAAEVQAVLAHSPDLLMLPMFAEPAQLREFCRIVAGRCGVVPLLETRAAFDSIGQWIATPGLAEVFVGLNDLHASMGLRFMFEPLAMGLLDEVAAQARAQGLPFGFGGIARLDEGLLPGRSVLGEHLRLGSSAVILSRTFHRPDSQTRFEDEVLALRRAERELALRSPAQVAQDARQTAETIRGIAASMAAPR